MKIGELARKNAVWREGAESFYDQRDRIARVCRGTSCELKRPRPPPGQLGEVRCLGYCYAAPTAQSPEGAVASGDKPCPLPPMRSLVERPVVLRNLLGARASPAAEYELPDGATILARVSRTGLVGRGGAAFPVARKWESAKSAEAPDRVVVANGDEGDSGSYLDRLLLEEDPHAVLAGMLACARAIGASRGVIYIRGEYPRAQAVVEGAIAEASASGWMPGFTVEVVSGKGSYVCGEETALLRSIEGFRGEPYPKPPYPAQRGLQGLPTVVQNVETLAVVPHVARTGQGADTKAFSLSGALVAPGLVEARLGTPLRTVLQEGGGGPTGGGWKMAMVGGPMGRVLPESRFDLELSFEDFPAMGHGGVVVLDQSTPARALLEHLFHFARAESCGSCTPCRAGTALLGACRNRAELERLLRTLEIGSLCGFGQGVPRPIRDLLQHFGEELQEALP